jgi:hypothetical protein
MHPNGLCAGVHSSGDASRPARRCGPAKRLLALFVRYGTVRDPFESRRPPPARRADPTCVSEHMPGSKVAYASCLTAVRPLRRDTK